VTPAPRRERFLRDAGRIFGGQVVMTLIGIGTGVILARVLAPEGRGLFQLIVVTVPTLLANLVKLGIPQASVYFIRRRGVAAERVVSTAVVVAVGTGGLAVVGCYVARDWLLANLMKGASVEAFYSVLVVVPFVILQAYLMGIAQGLEHFREYNFQQIVPNVLALVGMAVVLLWLDLGLTAAVWTQVGILVFTCLWIAVRVNRLAPIRPHLDVSLLRGMLTFGGLSHVQTLAATSHMRIDQALIGYLSDSAQVGMYTVAVNLTGLLLRVPDALGTVLFPRLAAADDVAAHAATATVCRHTFALMVLGAAGYALAGPSVLRVLYGSRFEESIVPMLILLPGVVMMALYLLLTRNFTSRNRQHVNAVAAVTALVVNVGLNVWLIPRWGIRGSALSSVVSYGLAASILLVMFHRESGLPYRAVLLLRRDDLRALWARLAGGRRS
jgi:O-antigen/teichoic acid export membrane protein